jgi:hypothetical protein
MMKFAFHLLLIHTSHFIMAGLRNAFINMQGSILEHIRKRLVGFLMTKVIRPKREFHFLQYN